MSCSAEMLIYHLHCSLLRTVASTTQLHFQGLAQAARHLRVRGLVSSTVAKKLQNIDGAYNLCRHITSVSSQNFADQVSREILTGLSSNTASSNTASPCSLVVEVASCDGSRSPVDADTRIGAVEGDDQKLFDVALDSTIQRD